MIPNARFPHKTKPRAWADHLSREYPSANVPRVYDESMWQAWVDDFKTCCQTTFEIPRGTEFADFADWVDALIQKNGGRTNRPARLRRHPMEFADAFSSAFS